MCINHREAVKLALCQCREKFNNHGRGLKDALTQKKWWKISHLFCLDTSSVTLRTILRKILCLDKVFFVLLYSKYYQ